ncbi:hypothetical protein EUGRSUZ_H01455 [Eucalyptus grandis]|uniref:Uncharacterized protein n=4 Tax=Eucalyptus grandis TaxID=71139 RepID=A0A059AXW6_EUCGR|nr:hypothetical protein EUGRSUZ_H01455 [Eucalyptus grandis]
MSIIPLPARHLLPLTTATIDFPSKPSSRSFHSSSPPIAGADLSVFSLGCFNPSHFCAGWPRRKRLSSSQQTWLCGIMRRDQDVNNSDFGEESEMRMLGSEDDAGTQIPTQAQSLVEGSGAVLVSEYKPVPEVDYLQELLAIQQQGPRAIGFFGTRNMGFMHQELIEILSYAMVITKNHIYTSGASGTNAAVIRGALRAEKPDLLTVILPQSLKKQPPESQELLSKVQNVIEKPYNDHLPLIEASRLCNMDIISQVQQVICFAFHDSRLLMETCQEAKNLRKIVTLFYLD